MPSALETIVKILKLEREQGGNNAAVVGGLQAYVETWQPQAREQARRARHHILIDEIVDELAKYEGIENEAERIVKVNYLLDRVTNRVPPPKAYRDRLSDWEEKLKTMSDRPRRSERRNRPAHSDQRRDRSQRSRRDRDFKAYDSATYDEDYESGSNGNALDLQPLPTLSRPPRTARAESALDVQRAHIEELASPTKAVKGIGAKFAELLGQLDLHTIGDLLYSFPRDYRDYTKLSCIKDLPADAPATVIATITRSHVVASGGGKDLVVEVTDGSDTLSVRFFRQHFLGARLRRGMQLVLNGKVSYFRDTKQMANPDWEELDVENLHSIGIVPVYRMTSGLRPRLFRNTMKALTGEWTEKIPDPIPLAILERAELADLGWALKQRHFPEGWDHLRHAQRRLEFDIVLQQQLALLGNRREWQAVPGPQIALDDEYIASFIEEVFPFELTGAQKRAIDDIRADLGKPVPMNRLIQGDVGSGKTAVAMVAMAFAIADGKQAALMAPTGILAEQHYRAISDSFAKSTNELRPVIALLTSALSTSERESIYRGIADGSIDIVIGTHALIQEGVEFKNLAIAVIDEQQRFGVDQRARLRGKGGNPHLLVMSATPYPRTMALTVYADLDLTVIDEKPPGRREIETRIIDPLAMERLHGFIIAQLEQGRQAFFVHPLVEESESIAAPAAIESFDRLSQIFFRFRVCLLHGRMSAAEKDELMADFAQHKYDVMVTTTVAEVGIDIPNASVIVIDGANRFGLSQLHQFRGRVGRGAHQSYCFLIPDHATNIDSDRIRRMQSGELDAQALSAAESRLSALEASNDGFHLAEVDMQLRGYGELLGRQQSGSSRLQTLEKISPEIVELAYTESRTLFAEDPALELPEHQLLADMIARLYPDSGDVS